MNKCKSCGHETKELKSPTIVINGVEYENETHDFNKTLAEIQIPKGWRLLKPSEAMMLWEREPKRDWYFVEQPRKNTKDVARFYADSDWAYLGCNVDPAVRDSGLGVRFCRKKISKSKGVKK